MSTKKNMYSPKEKNIKKLEIYLRKTKIFDFYPYLDKEEKSDIIDP